MKVDKILIIEDEKPNADRLKRLLFELRPDIEVLAVLDSVHASIAWFAQNDSPDVVMMDVRLADGISFEIFNQVSISCPVIFTTAYDEYAVRAFKYNSVDYLLKPIEKEELKCAIEKLEYYISQATGLNPNLENLLNYIQPKEYRSRFLLPYRDSYKTVKVDDIAYFCSEMNVTYAKLFSGSTEIVPQTLEKLEQQLNPKEFFRTNRQYIIHINSILKVHNYFNGKLKIELKTDVAIEIIISREKAPIFKAWMDY